MPATNITNYLPQPPCICPECGNDTSDTEGPGLIAVYTNPRYTETIYGHHRPNVRSTIPKHRRRNIAAIAYSRTDSNRLDFYRTPVNGHFSYSLAICNNCLAELPL